MMDKKIFREVPEVVHSAVLETLDSLDERSAKKTFHLSWAAAACLACFLVSGITVSAIGIVSMYRQRMEDMDKESIEEYYTIALAGETVTLNRPYTDEEALRYEELSEKYENSGLFPESQITYLQNTDSYSGKGVALDISSARLYLPEEALSDEELLEIIDYHHKTAYSIYKQNEARIISGDGWESRMAQLDDETVDKVYLTVFGCKSDISEVYGRRLTETESERYEELNRQYEDEGIYVEAELTIIQNPEEYTGEGIAICAKDSTYYFPEMELTDEEILMLIDFQHKVTYCIDRIHQEIRMGFRLGYPGDTTSHMQEGGGASSQGWTPEEIEALR